MITRSEGLPGRNPRGNRCHRRSRSSAWWIYRAGDLFAAGFLVGLARAADHRACARLGALAAAEVIGHLGARPQSSLAALAEENGLRL